VLVHANPALERHRERGQLAPVRLLELPRRAQRVARRLVPAGVQQSQGFLRAIRHLVRLLCAQPLQERGGAADRFGPRPRTSEARRNPGRRCVPEGLQLSLDLLLESGQGLLGPRAEQVQDLLPRLQ